MPLKLQLVRTELLENYLSDGHMEGFTIAEGALPPHAFLQLVAQSLRRGEPVLWNSFFMYIEGETVVGSGGFKGSPDSGKVEIGYGVSAHHRNRGVATEAVRLLIDIARTESDIDEIIAEAALDNMGSQRVLQKAGFKRIGQRQTSEDGMVSRWRFKLSS